MTDLTRDLDVSGMPFVSQREYVTNMLFIGQEITPDTTDEEVGNYLTIWTTVSLEQLPRNKNKEVVLLTLHFWFWSHFNWCTNQGIVSKKGIEKGK